MQFMSCSVGYAVNEFVHINRNLMSCQGIMQLMSCSVGHAVNEFVHINRNLMSCQGGLCN